ncbi:MAG: BrnT family toxin [Phycisphaerales bacterium]|nr:BrnT family toxin [Phycisphaerales bacterium]MDP6987149.1 BrnT family toxin [Phycisphaerales bacterium]
MNESNYSWDESKNQSNQAKHGISFDEACHVFQDDQALLIHDPDHSTREDRFVILGFSSHSRLLVVVHSWEMTGDRIRIISARRATRREWRHYLERHQP